MSFLWGIEAELSLKSVGVAAVLFEDKMARKQPFRTKESARDVVTALDVAIERAIGGVLAESPHTLIGEELAPDVKATGRDTCWFVDPIDGTANFVNGIPFFGASVGLMSAGAFEVGAVVLPALHELYFVSDSKEAFLNGYRLNAVSGSINDSLIGMAFSSREADKGARAAEFALFGSLNDCGRGCLRTGSAAINICYVAANKLQAAVGIRNKIWDVAGALAVASASGCSLSYKVDWSENRISYVVGCPEVTDIIVQQVDAILQIKLSSQTAKAAP